MSWSVEKMRRLGMSEREIQQATCEHDYGNMCESTFTGCVRTCQKCRQMMGLGRNCWEHATLNEGNAHDE